MKDVKATIVKSAIEASGSNFVSVTFIKKTDGKERTIVFNPAEDKKANKLKTGGNAQATKTRRNNNPNLINVIDSSIANREEDRRKGWRSFHCEDVISMKVGGVEVELN